MADGIWAGTATRALMPRASANTGSHRNTGASSISGMLSTLIPVFLISSVVFLAFLLLRKKLPRVYAPRTYLDSLRNWQLSPKQTGGVLGWRKEYKQLTDEFVLGHASIDNYLFLRFFKMLTMMCFVGCIITWPILFPVNATGNGGQAGLDILSFSNINPGPRYYAQVFVAWLFLGFVMFLIWRESKYFVRLRQQYYLSPYQSSKISTRTVLFVNVPVEARNEEYLRSEFSLVRNVWLVNVPEDLADKVDERDKAAAKLETGEIKLIKSHVKRQIKAQKKAEKKGESVELPVDESGPISVNPKDRPTHRLPKLKFLPIGKKVDTIDWSRGELRRLIPEVSQEQREHRNDRENVQGACFVEFETVQAAYTAMQKAGIKSKAKMTPKEMGTTPDDVIWKNIIKPFPKVKTFAILGTAFIWFLCIFWSIPVAVIGSISNISSLTQKVPFLGFINDIPGVVLGVVTGLLPAVLLSILMSLVPIVCSILAKLFEPTQRAAQMKVQAWYFPFQVIQVFLVTTFASGAAAVVQNIINNPSMATTLLARNLPKASNFYIAYFILFGLLQAALQLLNIVPLLFVLVLGKFLDSTPRKMWNRYVNLAGLGWGSLYPKFTNLGVIALSYSSIAPLVLGFATVGFGFLYIAFRYNALFTLGTNVSTRGESYARALQQLTVGIYISEICLIGLFAIGVGSTNQSIGPLVLMIIFLVGTIVWHVLMIRSLSKLSNSLPEEPVAEKFHQNAAGRENSDAEKAQETGQKKIGIVDRVKRFFWPLNAAADAIWSVSPNLGEPVRPYTQQEVDEAFLHPAVISEVPTIWIARDKYGLSKQEIVNTKKEVGEGLEVTDENAWFNEKGKLQWDEDIVKAPIYEDEPAY
ncbi:related to DUF221 domain [Lecanosticta acicola]|uniref:Related to DUF221 domain n=1 Tax=Lecanosticta acicola TaxID=111012 RepID=A0AAI9E8A4_9PEZI|nr:related to DUF221 domain [Lecanosticta acicola]